jgi:aldose 1-epimerase
MAVVRQGCRVFVYALVLCVYLCGGSSLHAQVTESLFGTTPDGVAIKIYTLQDGAMQARVMTYGARLVSLDVPDAHGNIADVVLGYDALAPYLEDHKTFFGGIIGRFANRIAAGSFLMDGKRYDVAKNSGNNSLHGGTEGFDKRVWTAQRIAHGVELTLVSQDGDQGFPGTLKVRVQYTLQFSTLKIEYFAVTDADTVVNLTSHSYFNLAGEGSGDILRHVVTIHADRYTPVNSQMIPTGEVASVTGTPFDFRKPTAIGARIDAANEQLTIAKGYDHNFVVSGNADQQGLHTAARVMDPASSRVLVVKTTQPGVQFNSGNALDGTVHGKHGHVYGRHASFCLETQHFPDSPNRPAFPSIELKPGQTFHAITEYVFSAVEGSRGAQLN